MFNFEARYWIYLRCSPIICIADCLSIVIRLTVYGSVVLARVVPISFRDRLHLVVHNRFIGHSEDDEAEGVAEVGRMTWLRWLFFIFGTLTPAIKLLSFTGMPWTKAWGVMFLVSFLIVEILVVLSWIGGRRGSPLHENLDPAKLISIKARLNALDRILFLLASITHALLLLCIAGDLWPNVDNELSEYSERRRGPLRRMIVHGGAATTKSSLVVLIFTVPLFAYFAVSEYRKGSIGKAVYLTLYSLLLAMASGCYIIITVGFNKWLMIDIVCVLGSIILAFALYTILGVLCSEYRTVAENLMLTSIDEDQSHPPNETDRDGRLVLVSFLYTVVFCMLWYAFRYDPTGTVNPKWTGVFG